MNTRSVTTLCFRPFELEQALDGAARAGFENVELCAVKGWLEHVDPDDASPQAVRRVERALADSGLRATSLAGHSEAATPEGLDRHLRLVRVCAELGIPYLNSFPGKDPRLPQERSALVANARRIGDEAAALGLTFCFENDGKAAVTGREVANLLAEIGHDHVGMNYDPANAVYFGGADTFSDLADALPWTRHFHVKDQAGGQDVANFPPLGEGELDVPGILAAVEQSGYAGPMCLEIEFDGTWPDFDGCVAAARRSREYWEAVGPAAS